MGGEIIAEKFALIKTRGGNGVAFTHIVEDTLLGERAVVKVSDKFGLIALDYLKAMNLAQEMDVPGVLMPLEGGILEEEAGYYFAFPEVGEPSLEDYLRIGAPLACEQALGIVEQVLSILEGLHRAGLRHLFINTRNVFYRPRGRVTLKDPALKAEFFYPLLDSIAAPDFSYFSPEVMDGDEPGTEADLYAVGRLAERLLERCADSGTSPAAKVLRGTGERLLCAARGDGASAGDIAEEIRSALSACCEAGADLPPGGEREGLTGSADGARAPAAAAKRRKWHRRGYVPRAELRLIVMYALVFVLGLGLVAFTGWRGLAERAPAEGGAGGSGVGSDPVMPARSEVRGGPEQASAAAPEGGAEGEAGEAAEARQGGVYEPRHKAAAGTGNNPAAGDAQTRTRETTETPAESSPAAPVASFTLTPTQGQSPLQVHLDASASYDPDGSIISYAWSCGGSGMALYRVFESNVIPETVSVTLTVTDDGGHSASTTRYLTLY